MTVSLLVAALAGISAGVIHALSGPDHAPVLFDRWKPWLVLAFVLIALAYGPSLLQLTVTTPFDAPGLRVW